MTVRPAEYGSRGVVGIGVPQANPTVEQEMWALRPPGVSLVTVRLCSTAPDTRGRLEEYLRQLGDSLRQFDELGLDAFGFACTGSTYLLGHEAERQHVAALEDAVGYPIITAAAAIEEALVELDAHRIAIIAPYPEWLGDIGAAYWTSRGFEVVAHARATLAAPDTRNIYRLTSNDALHVLDDMALATAGPARVDVVLFSGTGMPSLRAVTAAADRGIRAISSNLCLANSLSRKLGLQEAPRGEVAGATLLRDWGTTVATL
jgi:maleate isomerase